VPGMTFQQDSPDYRYTMHSAADTLDTVKPEVLAQNATIMAVTVFWLADRPERFAAPWPPEKTARMLRDQGAYELLKGIGSWPFGELGAEPTATAKQKAPTAVGSGDLLGGITQALPESDGVAVSVLSVSEDCFSKRLMMSVTNRSEKPAIKHQNIILP